MKKDGNNGRYEKIPTAGMGRREWLALRKTGLGGSDAGAVCGLNPFSSPMKLFYDKTGGVTEEADNEAARQGRDLEDYVARRFMEKTGLKVRRSNYMYRSLENPFMIADVDFLVTGEDAGLECKTVGAYSADKWKDGNIPLHYMMQCYHYMAVTGKRAWYIAAVILGRGFIFHKLEWEDELIDGLTAAEKDFWENHVEAGKVPEPDGSGVCEEVLQTYFRTARKGSVIELEGFDEKLDRREEIIGRIKELEQERSRIEQEVKLYMKENESAVSGRYRVSWSSVDSMRLDAKRIKEERPDIYKDYARISVSRRFQIKAA